MWRIFFLFLSLCFSLFLHVVFCTPATPLINYQRSHNLSIIHAPLNNSPSSIFFTGFSLSLSLSLSSPRRRHWITPHALPSNSAFSSSRRKRLRSSPKIHNNQSLFLVKKEHICGGYFLFLSLILSLLLSLSPRRLLHSGHALDKLSTESQSVHHPRSIE